MQVTGSTPSISSSVYFLEAYFNCPSLCIIPDSYTDAQGNTYESVFSPDTRPTNISLDLGIYDETINDYSIHNNVTVINETTNVFTNPGSGASYCINNWSYDYSTRTYFLVLSADGSLLDATVEFGLDNLNINLGGDSQSYSYMKESHVHSYTGVVTTEPSCTSPGTKTFTCDTCGDVYLEPVPALGHDMHVDEIEPVSYYCDTSELSCPDCAGQTVTSVQIGESDQFLLTCHDCGYSWPVTGSARAGRTVLKCTRCGHIEYTQAGEDIDNSDLPFWAWLQRWLQNFKLWLGEKLDARNESDSDDLPDIDVSIDLEGDRSDVSIHLPGESSSGTEEEAFSLRDITKKFRFIKDIYQIGRTLIAQVSADAAAASYDANLAIFDGVDSGSDSSNGSDPPLLRSAPSLSAGSAPSLMLDLGAANSVYGWSYGGQVEFLDLSWYTPYKSTVDNLLSGFLWISFGWLLFRKAPGIISGSAIDSHKVDDLSEGHKTKR